jgi:hypothetical protein
VPDTLETGEGWDNPTSFDNPSYNWDNTSMVPNFEMKQLASQKMLKYSVSDALSTQMEKDIDDLVERTNAFHFNLFRDIYANLSK